MADQLNQVFFPGSFPELFTVWSRFPDAVPFAGGTEIIRNQGTAGLVLPKTILSLAEIDELERITRTERYLEIGAMAKLNDLAQMGKIVPEALTRCIGGISGPQLRNLATIGGNLCVKDRRLDISASLVALDAVYELRNAQSARWISASRFSSPPGPPAIGPQELLTRIRIPREHWNYTACRKFGACNSGKNGGIIVFVLKNQKTTLTDIRLVFAGEGILRDKNAEAVLIGKHLPLNRRDAADFVEHWRVYLSALGGPGPLIHAEILNFIESLMSNLLD
jgi:CO/xanthine dehydrogenase FAD-binding subunit